MKIEFDHHIPSTLSCDQLWALLQAAFVDSRQSPLWPRQFETLRSEAGLTTGARIDATYHVGPLDTFQSYIIPEADPEAHSFSYQNGHEHPLVGGGTVTLHPVEGGCILHWTGGYDVPWRPRSLGAAAFVKLWFEGRFFDTIRHNIRQIEADQA